MGGNAAPQDPAIPTFSNQSTTPTTTAGFQINIPDISKLFCNCSVFEQSTIVVAGWSAAPTDEPPLATVVVTINNATNQTTSRYLPNDNFVATDLGGGVLVTTVTVTKTIAISPDVQSTVFTTVITSPATYIVTHNYLEVISETRTIDTSLSIVCDTINRPRPIFTIPWNPPTITTSDKEPYTTAYPFLSSCTGFPKTDTSNDSDITYQPALVGGVTITQLSYIFDELQAPLGDTVSSNPAQQVAQNPSVTPAVPDPDPAVPSAPAPRPSPQPPAPGPAQTPVTQPIPLQLPAPGSAQTNAPQPQPSIPPQGGPDIQALQSQLPAPQGQIPAFQGQDPTPQDQVLPSSGGVIDPAFPSQSALNIGLPVPVSTGTATSNPPIRSGSIDDSGLLGTFTASSTVGNGGIVSLVGGGTMTEVAGEVPSATIQPTMVIISAGGQVVTADSQGNFVISGSTLSPTGGSVDIVLGGSTTTVPVVTRTGGGSTSSTEAPIQFISSGMRSKADHLSMWAIQAATLVWAVFFLRTIV